MSNIDYHRPTTLDELWPLRQAHPGGRVVAGGTDMMVRVASRLERPGVMFSLRGIAELCGVEEDADGGVCIGATTTIADITDHPLLRERYPVLVEAAGCLGSPQIRNAATVGGNLCNASPCADTAPPLLVLEATARLRGPGGERDVPLVDFFRGPGETCMADDEILAALVLPAPAPGARGAFLKKRRVRMDLALASVALQLTMDGATCVDARVAAGSVAPVPLRMESVEQVLCGAAIDDGVLEQAAEAARQAVSPITDLRTTDEYRRHIIGVYVKRTVQRAAGGAS